MFLTAETWTVDGQSLGVLVLQPKTFHSGKAGYHGQGKLTLDGRRYQAQTQLVAIASKSDAGDVEAANMAKRGKLQ